jgi:hypothetical protein
VKAHQVAWGGIVLALVIGLMGFYQTFDTLYTEQPRASAMVGELVASAKVGQTFVAAYPGLTLVQIMLDANDRRNTGPLIFHLQTAPNAAEDLVILTLDTAVVEKTSYHTFKFPPIRDSAGRSFYFYLEAPQAKRDNAITVRGATEDVYPAGTAVLRGVQSPAVRDLAFRLEYDPPMTDRINLLLDRLPQNKPAMWGDKRLYILLAAAYLTALYALFVRAARINVFEQQADESPSQEKTQ